MRFTLYEENNEEVVRQPLKGFPHEDAAALRAVQTRPDKLSVVKDDEGRTRRTILPLPRSR